MMVSDSRVLCKNVAVCVMVHEVKELKIAKIRECQIFTYNERPSAFSQIVRKNLANDVDLESKLFRLTVFIVLADSVVETVVDARHHVSPRHLRRSLSQ